jgi:hypothetical protein
METFADTRMEPVVIVLRMYVHVLKKRNKTKYHAKIDIFMIVPLVSSNSSYIETVTIVS